MGRIIFGDIILDIDSIEFAGVEYDNETDIISLNVHMKSGKCISLESIMEPSIHHMYLLRILNALFINAMEKMNYAVIPNSVIDSVYGLLRQVEESNIIKKIFGDTIVSLAEMYNAGYFYGIRKYGRSDKYKKVLDEIEHLASGVQSEAFLLLDSEIIKYKADTRL